MVCRQLVSVLIDDNVVSVDLSIPIFTAGRNRGTVEAATSKASAARLHREHLEAAIPQDVEAAFRPRSTACRCSNAVLSINPSAISTSCARRIRLVSFACWTW